MSIPIKIYNTASLKKELFIPLDPSKKSVGFYLCGPTVYDYIHIGNARPLVIFDVLFRILKTQYDNVIFVRNITDIDDKINTRALERNISIQQLTSETIKQYKLDVKAIQCLEPSVEPCATHHISDIIKLIKSLINNKNAYMANNHVLFDVSTMSEYGKFAHKNQDDLIAGARVEVAPYKKKSCRLYSMEA